MTHKEKLQQFRVQIRSRQISQLLAQKRFCRDQQLQISNSIPQPQPLDLQLLMRIAKAAQVQENIEELHRQGWPNHLKPYLSSQYNHTEEQIYAASALSNMLFLSQAEQPSEAFTRDILQIIDGNSSTKTLTSVLRLVFNLAHDYKDWVDNLVRHEHLMSRLSLVFEFEDISYPLLTELILTTCKIITKANISEQFLKVGASILNMIDTNVALDPLLLAPTLHCLCELSKRFSKQIGSKIVQSRFFKKIGAIIKVLTDPKIVEYYVTLAIITIEDLAAETFQKQIFLIVCQKIETAPRMLRLKIQRLLYLSLQQKKLDLQLFSQQPIFNQLFGEYEETDDLTILEQLSYIFCLCLLNLKHKSMLSSNIVHVLKRAKNLLSDNLDTQGLIQETLIEYEKLTTI